MANTSLLPTPEEVGYFSPLSVGGAAKLFVGQKHFLTFEL